MTDDRIPCAILGAGGYIGQHFSRLLADHPWFQLPLLIGAESSRLVPLAERWMLSDPRPSSLSNARIRHSSPAGLERSGVRIVFSALPSGSAGPIERECARRGIAVFSNAADLRMASGAPLLVPEVNGSHLSVLGARPRRTAPIVTNPNCTATGLVLAIAPLRGLLGVRAVHVATYQSLSGAGFPGVPALSVTDNVLPYIRGEEEKVESETDWILGRASERTIRPSRLPVLANCARVSTREGHLEAVTLEVAKRPELKEIRTALHQFDPLQGDRLPTAPHPPVELRESPDRPQPITDRWAGAPNRARGMVAVVGRLRWSPPYLRFFVLSHNAVRGGAGGSVLNAEFALRWGVLPGLIAPEST